MVAHFFVGGVSNFQVPGLLSNFQGARKPAANQLGSSYVRQLQTLIGCQISVGCKFQSLSNFKVHSSCKTSCQILEGRANQLRFINGRQLRNQLHFRRAAASPDSCVSLKFDFFWILCYNIKNLRMCQIFKYVKIQGVFHFIIVCQILKDFFLFLEKNKF